jgi:phosphotransferase system enzyme I (PtsI)
VARIRRSLSGGAADPWEGLGEGSVVLAQDLLPSETLRMDRTKVLAILTLGGSVNSHSSNIARSLEIPAVVGLGEAGRALGAGATVIVDGSAGFVIAEPSEAELAAYRTKRAAWRAEREEARRFAGLPTRTADGKALELGANIGGPAEVEAALAGGAEAIGLFRTEFMFMDRPSPPGEEEQYVAYRHVLERMGDGPVIIRTLDAGGDKPIAGLQAKAEENPFLGQRAIRFCLAHEDIFRSQLRALLRASVHGKLRIMLPMIAVADELRAARAILEEEASGLRASGFRLPALPELGIMIEIPAAALDAERLAREADFFSIGTNDLVQYLMAADRMNPDVAYLNRPLHPVVLGLIGRVAAAAAKHGRRVAVCGEMAADPLALLILAGLGIHELSMSPALIPQARARLSRLDSRRLSALAARALEAEDAEEVKRLAREELAAGGIHHGL